MNGAAIMMLIISMVIVWGGLVAAVLHLWRHRGVNGDLRLTPEMTAEDDQREAEAPLHRDT